MNSSQSRDITTDESVILEEVEAIDFQDSGVEGQPNGQMAMVKWLATDDVDPGPASISQRMSRESNNMRDNLINPDEEDTIHFGCSNTKINIVLPNEDSIKHFRFISMWERLSWKEEDFASKPTKTGYPNQTTCYVIALRNSISMVKSPVVCSLTVELSR